MKKNTSQLRIIPLNGETRAVLIDHAGKTYGIVRADTLRFLVRKNLIKKIVNNFDEISYAINKNTVQQQST